MGVKSVMGIMLELDVYVRLLQIAIEIIGYQHCGHSCLRLHEIPEHSHESVW